MAHIDGKSFEQEVMALLPRLYSVALRFAGNQADAEDLVSEAVLKAWTARASLRSAEAFRGWMLCILVNHCRGKLRERRAHPDPEVLPDEGSDEFSLFEKLHQPFLLWWCNPERQFFDRLLSADLERAIAALPEAFRQVVVLADVQGFSYAEIAALLEVPVGTVRSRLSRGRSILQKALWEHASEMGLVAARPSEPSANRV